MHQTSVVRADLSFQVQAPGASVLALRVIVGVRRYVRNDVIALDFRVESNQEFVVWLARRMFDRSIAISSMPVNLTDALSLVNYCCWQRHLGSQIPPQFRLVEDVSPCVHLQYRYRDFSTVWPQPHRDTARAWETNPDARRPASKPHYIIIRCQNITYFLFTLHNLVRHLFLCSYFFANELIACSNLQTE